ncbi:MAG: PAS domain S-box protein, partial [Gammaproteobacteria bacterium]
MAERNFLPVLVITQSQNNAEKINSILRTAGHAVRSQWADNLEDAEQRITAQLPDLIFSFLKVAEADIGNVVNLRDGICPSTPILAVTEGYDETVAASLMTQGVRDLVSLENEDRLTAIVAREIDVLAHARSLETAETLLHEYQDRFHSILEESGDSIAYIQDGIHLSANPAWLELFGIKSESELEGIPVMDLVTPKDQGQLKTALKNATKGKTVEPLKIHGVKSDGTKFETTFEFDQTDLEGEHCVEISVRDEGDTSELVAKMEELGRRDPLTGRYHRHSFV